MLKSSCRGDIMKKKRYFNKKNILYLSLISSITFSCSLYYKRYLPDYLIHSIVIFLVILFFYFSFLLNKYKKQHNFIKLISLMISICLFISGIMIFNHNDKLSKDGIYIGIDISKWNEQVDLQLAIQEIDYVIIRCGYTSSTDGTKTIEDPYFKKNIRQCEELSIPYGIYYYSLARDNNQAKKEALFVNSLLKDKTPDLGVFIDLEDEEFQGNLSNDTLSSIAINFLENIPNYNKKGIYANHHWWTTKLTDNKLNTYIKWKARYNDTPTIEEDYHILQYSETGKIKGVIGDVDLNMISNKYW